MTRSELLNLMQFVCDQNSAVFYETINAQNMNLTEKQVRAVLQALESTTKNNFMRFAERMS